MNKRVLFKAFAIVLVMLGYNAELFAQIIPTDIQGRRLKTKNYIEVKGTPYLFEEWSKGSVKFMNGSIYNGMLKYDLIEDEVFFNDKNNEPMGFADPVLEFTIEDPTKGASPKEKTFKKGFGNSPLDKQSNNLFFEILVEGDMQLLKQTKKDIVQQTLYNSATPVQHIKELVTYYTYNKGNLTKFKPNEKQLLVMLEDKAPDLKVYIKENKLDVKKEEDLKKLFVYYNSKK